MLIEFGNPNPIDGVSTDLLPGPAETRMTINENDPSMTLEPGADVRDLALAIASAQNGVVHLPDHGYFVHVTSVWGSGFHSLSTPTWVACSSDTAPDKAAELQRLLCEFWSCAAGRPADVEDTHYTLSGAPGVHPSEG